MSSVLNEHAAPAKTGKLQLGDTEVELPVVIGTENEKAIDISHLRAETGFITLDEGYVNTGPTTSAITYLDGEKGVLRYRGYPIETLAKECSFRRGQLSADLRRVAERRAAGNLPQSFAAAHHAARGHEVVLQRLPARRPSDGDPQLGRGRTVDVLPGLARSARSEAGRDLGPSPDGQAPHDRGLCSYKKSIGQPFVYPQNDLGYCENFLRMMFSVPSEPYQLDPDFVEALNLLLIVHADHEQNCSTSTVRMVGSSNANLFASISAGICALWGPLHGGANQACVEMLEQILADGGNVGQYVEMAKDKNSGFRLMGFGHRVYKNFDPRATIIKAMCDRLLAKSTIKDPIFEVAQQLEHAALSDPYFIERKLYPNVDFYSGIIYRAIGIPVQMFTVLFAIGRLPGWIAHWIEMHASPTKKICRPRQIYTGKPLRDFVPLDRR